MGKESLKIIHYKGNTEGQSFSSSVLELPHTFSTGAIKEILTRVMNSKGQRNIVYLEDASSSENYKILTGLELKHLRDYSSREDRLAILDMKAMEIKRSEIVMLIELRS